MAPMVATATMATYPMFLNILGGIRGCTLQKNPSVESQRDYLSQSGEILTVNSKCGQSCDADKQGAENFSARPRVRRSPPRKAN